MAVWTEVLPRTWGTAPEVDVFIPVYGGLQETLACLHSVLTAPVRTPHRVVVINDAGPDPELNALLRSLAARDLFVLEQHRSNLGFVKTVNHGLRLCKGHDVVILNSDTVVYNDWLDRLLAHARAHPRLASVTPLSNNATICSYPETLADNRVGLELSHAEIDRLAGEVNRGVHVEAPTGVGFCMYMRRAAIDEVGGLDERHFGRGYGEENDWCQRALRKGGAMPSPATSMCAMWGR
jgi:GT2 family glycosyltransferase